MSEQPDHLRPAPGEAVGSAASPGLSAVSDAADHAASAEAGMPSVTPLAMGPSPLSAQTVESGPSALSASGDSARGRGLRIESADGRPVLPFLDLTAPERDIAAIVEPVAPAQASLPGDAPSPLTGLSPRSAARKSISSILPEGVRGFTVPPAPAAWEGVRKHAPLVGALTVAVALGFVMAQALPASGDGQVQARLAETTASVRVSQQEVTRLTGELRSLKSGFDALKEHVERPRPETARLAQLSDKVERLGKDTSDKIARLGDGGGKGTDPARLAGLADRIEKLEKQVAAATAAARTPLPPPAPVSAAPAAATPVAAKAAEPSTTGSITEKAKPKAAAIPVLRGWVLRDVDRGMALIESSTGRLREISPGDTLPGGAKVERLERQGRAWVVLTSKGVIAPE